LATAPRDPASEPASPPWRLHARGIVKRYGSLLANNDVSLELRSGEIHAVLGENGAGKSTIMKVLYGMERPDGGVIEKDGAPLAIRSPSDAIAAGIGMVHQHFMLVPTLTVLENLILGTPLAGRFVTRKGAARGALRALAARYRIAVDLDRPAGKLSVGEQQRVEVLKALVRGARALILDEPTAVLTPREVEDLGRTLRDLKSQGHGIFIVTHKLAEVMGMSDRVSVMRRGQVVGTWKTSEIGEAALVKHMVGHGLDAPAPRAKRVGGRPMLDIADAHVAAQDGRGGLKGLDLRVAAGEILGVAGVEGNGQAELADAITGLRPLTAGDITLDGERITHRGAAERLAAGIAHVPEDRHRDGVVLDFSVCDNAILVDHSGPKAQRRGVIDRAAVTRFTEGLIRDFTIRCAGPAAPMRSLSGGNQQKLVLARELARAPKLLVATQPTRGLDIGAIADVHARLRQASADGMAVLLISSELDEIIALSDRVAVLREGRIAGVVETPTLDAIGALMLGSTGARAGAR
jgi:simple sugar transport system ATP-binding protein